MRMLITGAAGMLGQDVVAVAEAAGNEVQALSRAELDITDEDAVQRAIAAGAPDVVVNCAAWTDVDGAESAEQRALAVNGAGAGNVARAAAAAGAWTIHVSSDYVFDGTKQEPYLESDPVLPLSAYGRTKLAGEHEAARGAPGRHTVVRSSWLFGSGGPCFPATILRLASEQDELTVVDDQVGCPTFTGHLAGGLVTLAQNPLEGIVHMAAAGACSWYEFARQIVADGRIECDVKPGSTEDLARPAPRPPYSVLGSVRRPQAPVLPSWREGLSEYLAAGVGAR